MPCPKCNKEMERRNHKPAETAYLKKAYYYSEWDYCGRCKHVQHYERYKIRNDLPKKVFKRHENQISPAVKNIWQL